MQRIAAKWNLASVAGGPATRAVGLNSLPTGKFCDLTGKPDRPSPIYVHVKIRPRRQCLSLNSTLGGKRSFAEAEANGEVAPRADAHLGEPKLRSLTNGVKPGQGDTFSLGCLVQHRSQRMLCGII